MASKTLPTPAPVTADQKAARRDQPLNSVALSGGSAYAATCLITGGIAHMSREKQGEWTKVVAAFCGIVSLYGWFAVTAGTYEQWPHRGGPIMAAGLLGFGVGGCYSLVHEAEVLIFFSSAQAGMLVGWLVEGTAHPIGRYLGHEKKHRGVVQSRQG